MRVYELLCHEGVENVLGHTLGGNMLLCTEYFRQMLPISLQSLLPNRLGFFNSLRFNSMAYVSMGEAHRRITDYLNRFSDAVFSQDVASLKLLFSFSSNSHSLLSLADALNVFQVQFFFPLLLYVTVFNN